MASVIWATVTLRSNALFCSYVFPSFRKHHEGLRAVVQRTFRAGKVAGGVTFDLDLPQELERAYECVRSVDCLDVTPEGHRVFEAAVER